jgi:SulP family sulfate permease
MSDHASDAEAKPTDRSLTPKLYSVLHREGYAPTDLKADALTGLTVAIVALPLSMAIAIASGLPPERGLFAAIVGGFLISFLGGSRYQIGGPAGAFIVLVYAVLERHGYDGLLLATLLAGLMMIIVGWLRLGPLIRLIPIPVVVGFTSGIGVIILASQLKEILGVELAREPTDLLPKLAAISAAIGTAKPVALGLSAAGVAVVLALRHFRPAWPAFLIVVALSALAAALLPLGVATIGSRFGGVPTGLPAPILPPIDAERLLRVVPDAVAIALLGSIESLLSAVVADRMSGDRHRSNAELVAQGVANIGCAIFGGMPATGTIARTATNIRAGARSPVSGLLHAVYLLAFMMVAAPLAAHVPLAALAAVLAVVSWNMIDVGSVAAIVARSRREGLVLLTTLFVTVLANLLVGIAAGVTLYLALRFLARWRSGKSPA